VLSLRYCDVHAVGQQSTVETLVYNSFIAYDLLTAAVSSSDYAMSSSRMISE
jgi:hypothetical protein